MTAATETLLNLALFVGSVLLVFFAVVVLVAAVFAVIVFGFRLAVLVARRWKATEPKPKGVSSPAVKKP